MMAKGSSSSSCLFFPLLFLLINSICSSSGTLVGSSYHANANAGGGSSAVLYSTRPTLSLSSLRKNKVAAAISQSQSQSQIRVFISSDDDHRVLSALSHSHSRSVVSVDLYLNESLVENLRSCNSSCAAAAAAAVSWLKTHLLALVPQVGIKSIVVSFGVGGPSDGEDELVKLLSTTLKSIHSHLSSFNLPRQVKVSVAFSSSFLQKIKKSERDHVQRIFDFINKYGSLVIVELGSSSSSRGGDGQVVSMGLGSDEFVQSVIEVVMTSSTFACNRYSRSCTSRCRCRCRRSPPIVVVVKSPAVGNASSDDEAAEYMAKVEKSLETSKTEITARIAAALDSAQVPILGLEEIEFVKKEEDDEQMMMMMRFVSSPSRCRCCCCSPPSSSGSRRELLQHSGVRNTAHDNIINNNNNIPPSTTTTATTPTPTIVTVDPSSTNPVTVTPTNPAAADTPQPIPTTTPVTVPVPSANPNNPITNPVTVPAQQQPVTNPVTTYPAPTGGVPVSTPVPVAVPPPSSATATNGGGQGWCVARSGVSESLLQSALDYACGMGGADCSQIQQGANCYNPNSLQNHASYAFNSYYQKNPAPTSCDFGGTATLVNTNPSSGSCIYPSSSSSASQSTATPTSTPPAATSSTSGAGAGGGAGVGLPSSVTPPSSVLNSSSPPAGGSGGTGTVFGFDTPPSVNTTTSTTSTSTSAALHPSLITCIILLSTCFAAGLFFLDL